MEKKYFHELSDKEFDNAVKEHKTFKDFQQPTWCSYPNALEFSCGCWSLTERRIKSESDCKNCDCFEKINYEEINQKNWKI